jgi:hypothetical protein
MRTTFKKIDSFQKMSTFQISYVARYFEDKEYVLPFIIYSV